MKTDGDRCRFRTLRSAPRPLVYGSVRAVEGLVDALAYDPWMRARLTTHGR